MEKCIICGVDTDLQHRRIGLCNYCYNNIPSGVVEVAEGSSSTYILRGVTYTQDNWKEHYAVQARLSMLGEDLPRKRGYDPTAETNKNYTHSAEIEFKNGDKFIIPEPDNSWEGGQFRDYSFKSFILKEVEFWGNLYRLLSEDGYICLYTRHLEGMVMVKEYAERINQEGPEGKVRVNWIKLYYKET